MNEIRFLNDKENYYFVSTSELWKAKKEYYHKYGEEPKVYIKYHNQIWMQIPKGEKNND